ncbi:MAG TPA: hypothetical protein VMQ67_12700, partial [Candidatus Saccharimonadales bacterium]|nr:hypothetical protein [Candidatus Saccharimonadales bacterium]
MRGDFCCRPGAILGLPTPVFGHNLTTSIASPLLSMERVKGIEPSPQTSQPIESQTSAEPSEPAYTQIGAQIQGNDGRDLS